MTKLAKIEGSALASKPGLDDEQIRLIKNTIAKGATDTELALFVQTCNKLGLDPFARQIFLVKRWDSKLRTEVAQSQVSVDGLRLIAERTRQYRGQTAPQWCGADGKWVDVWLSDEPPAAARCGVYREGFAEPLVRVARYASYVQTTKDGFPNRMWKTMPDVMLSKCSESLALRAAFPNELSGVYSPEEMGQDSAERAPRKAAARRTLDDVAGDHAHQQMGQFSEPGDDHVPHDPETGEVVDAAFELEAPDGECPVFQSGKHSGQRYDAVPAGMLRALLAMQEYRDKASPHTVRWAEYLVAKHEMEKTR